MNKSTNRASDIQADAQAPLLSVKETADRSGLSAHTLRFYEKIGLLTPERAINGHRSYTESDLARLDFVAKLRATGMPLALIQEYISKPAQDLADLGERRQMLEKHCTAVEAHLAEIQENLRAIRVKISYLSEVEKKAGAGMDLESWKKFQEEQSLCGAELTISRKTK